MNKNNIKLAKGLILLCYLLYNMKEFFTVCAYPNIMSSPP